MKSLSAALLAVCVIFNISGITRAQNSTVCKTENLPCKSDDDCCSKVCRLTFSLKKYCKEMALLPTLMSKFSLTASVPTQCIYNVPANKIADEETLRTIGIFAAADHGILKPGTLVNVEVGNNTVELKISPRPAVLPGTLELSDMAASLLGVTVHGPADCKVRVPFWANHNVLRRFMILVPVSGVVYALYLFNQLNMY